MFNFNHLYYFFIAAQSETLSAAARRLRIRQPSLTAQIHVLEEFLGKKLFVREGRKLTLTEDGKNILGYCHQIFGPAYDLQQYIKGDLAEKSLHLRIGFSNELDRLFSTSMLAKLRTDRDDLHRITMASATHEELVERLKLSVYDCIVATQAVQDREFLTLAEVWFPVVIVYNPKVYGKISAKERFSLKHLPNQWVMPSMERTLRLETDRFFDKQKLKPVITFESDMLASIAHAAALGLGLALLPKPYVLEYEKSGELLSISNNGRGFWKSKVYLHCRRSMAKLPEILKIKSFLETYEIMSTPATRIQ